MALRASLEIKSEIVLVTALNTIPFPAAVGDGIAIDVARDPGGNGPAGAWKSFGNAQIDAAVFIESSVAQNFSAGLGLYGFRTDTAKWYLLGALNGGAPISTLGANTGFAATLQFAGIFNRLAIGPLAAANVTTSAGTATIRANQIRQVEEL